MKYFLAPVFFFLNLFGCVTNGTGRFSFGSRILIIPKANACLIQTENPKI